jgi:hypothetical protein
MRDFRELGKIYKMSKILRQIKLILILIAGHSYFQVFANDLQLLVCSLFAFPKKSIHSIIKSNIFSLSHSNQNFIEV